MCVTINRLQNPDHKEIVWEENIKMGHTEIVGRFSVKALTLGCCKHRELED
jgi:hypothetical protein